ncbi:hypothetical protein QJS04_geneDACA016606 [Acorus gramineus]|uniref:Uncharacterized protein n=1 Tax=Acorus gramineus TaxID=55184 RepID=A0AAV9BLQ5_ACOGR|nr:hypothetical protein QJS04_geneDACA016606 [Acorus gramineus]
MIKFKNQTSAASGHPRPFRNHPSPHQAIPIESETDPRRSFRSFILSKKSWEVCGVFERSLVFDMFQNILELS